MPNYEEVTWVRPLQTFPYELHNGFKYYFIKNKDTQVSERVAGELESKHLIERIFLNKAEGPSIHANSSNRPGVGAGDFIGIKSPTANRKK